MESAQATLKASYMSAYLSIFFLFIYFFLCTGHLGIPYKCKCKTLFKIGYEHLKREEPVDTIQQYKHSTDTDIFSESQGGGTDFLSKFIASSWSKFYTKVSVFHHIYEQQVKVTGVHRFSATIFGPVFPFASIWRDTVRSSFCLPGEIHYLPNSYLRYFPIHIYSTSQFIFTVFSNS